MDLDYAQGHIAPPFEPTDDDMYRLNFTKDELHARDNTPLWGDDDAA